MSALRLYNHSPLELQTLPYNNFHEILANHAKNNSPFIQFYDSGKLKSNVSFSEFHELVLDFSQTLLNLSLEEKGHVAVAMENSLEALICFSAVMNLGLTLIPVDPHQSEEYYKKLSMQFDCDLVITTEGHNSQKAFLHSLFYKKEHTGNLQSFKSAPPSVIFASSGTTGQSKGVVQSFSSLLINSLATIKVHTLNTDSKHFCILPLFHVNAFSFSFLTSLINGNELILNKNFSQVNFWETVNATNPQIISAIPPVIRVLTEDPRDYKITSSLKYFVSAASNLGKKTLIDFYQKFNIPVIQAYGLSETVNFTTTFPTSLSKADYEATLDESDKTSIGIEVWGNNVFLIDENSKEILSEKTEGELVVRGWNIMNEYYHSEEVTNEAFKNDFFHTGDIGYFKIIRGEKFYYLNGRKKEIAKVNGKLIYLNEVDELILALDYISNACSVCYLDTNQEEQLGVYLILKADKEMSAIKSDLKRILPANTPIKKIITGSDIKMTASGKKRRSEMAGLHFNQPERAL